MTKRWRRLWNGFDGLAGDTLWSGAHDAALMANALVSMLILQEQFDRQLLGNYFGLFGIIGVLGSLTYSGFGLAALQRLLGERADRNTTLQSFLALTLLAGSFSLLLGFVAGGLALGRLSLLEIGVMLAAELLAGAVVTVASFLVQGVVGFPAAIRVRVVLIGIRFATTVGLTLAGQVSVLNLALGFGVGFGVYGLWLMAVYLPRHGFTVGLLRPDRSTVEAGLTFSLPMATSKVQIDGDKYLLNMFGFASEAGLYGLAYRAMLMANAPLVAVEAAAFQRFIPKEEGVRGGHLRRANRLAWFLFAGGAAIAVALWFAVPIVEAVIFRSDKKEAAEILPWLLPLLPLMALSGTPLNGLIGLGRARERGYVYAASTAVSVVLYVVLIPPMGWRGALTATYLAEGFLVMAGWLSLHHFQKAKDERTEQTLDLNRVELEEGTAGNVWKENNINV